MAKAKKAVKKVSGWEKTKKLGRKGIMITVDPAQYELLKKAADLDRRKLAAYVKERALDAAYLEANEVQWTGTEKIRNNKPKKGGK